MNGITEYAYHNLPSLYLDLKTSLSNFKTNKIESFLIDLILMEDVKAFNLLWIIYRFGVKIYLGAISNGIPNLLYLSDDQLYDNDNNFYEE